MLLLICTSAAHSVGSYNYSQGSESWLPVLVLNVLSAARHSWI